MTAQTHLKERLTAEPERRPKILRVLSVEEFKRMLYICFASVYPIADQNITTEHLINSVQLHFAN
jgi:hypothetical protein